jgi:hypothetical protein
MIEMATGETWDHSERVRRRTRRQITESHPIKNKSRIKYYLLKRKKRKKKTKKKKKTTKKKKKKKKEPPNSNSYLSAGTPTR